MSPRKTRRGTLRENMSEESVDNNMKSTSKSVRRTRQTNKSEHGKSSEEDSDAVTEQSHNTTKTPSARSTRKRKKDQDQTLNELENTSCSAKNDSKVSKSKRQTRNKKQQVSAVNTTISENEALDSENQSKSSKKSKITKLRTSNIKMSDAKITPVSSPIRSPPLPKRSTKTPKKSPSNLGSPKTHARTALRSLNVPRKLTIFSPPPSLISVDTMSESSFFQTNESFMSEKNSKDNATSDKNKIISLTFSAKPQPLKSPKISVNNSNSNTPTSNKKSPSKKVFSKIEKSVKVGLTNSQELETSLPNKSLNKSSEKEQNSSQKARKSLSSVKPTNSAKLNTSKSKKSVEETLSSSIITSSFNLNESQKLVLSEKTSSKPSSSPKRKSKSPNQSSSKSKKPVKFVSSFTPGKTPKIALSSNIFKAKKSPSKKEKSPSKTEKSPPAKQKSSSQKEKSPSKTEKSLPAKQKSPSTKEKSLLKKEKSLVKKLTNKSADKTNLSLDVSMSPKVMLNKLTDSEINSLTPRGSRRSKDGQGSKSPKSTKRPSLVVSKPRTSISKSQASILKKSTAKSQNSTPVVVNKRMSLLKPLTSSTPREKTKRVSLSTIVKSKISKKLNNQTNSKIKLLEDESLPSMNNSSLIHLSAVYSSDDSENEITFGLDKDESKGKTKKQSNNSLKRDKNSTFDFDKSNSSSTSKDKTDKNNTYEVENPKTPKFQNKSNKRKFADIDKTVNEDQVAKKSCKVKFATPGAQMRGGSSGIIRQGTPGHVIHKRTPIVAKGSKASLGKQSFANRSSSAIKTQSKTPGSVNKRLSVSLSTNSAFKFNRSSQLSKLKPVVTLEKKTATKTPAGKIPNFAAIHQKKFEKMESLVDLRKRVEERHVTLNVPTSSTKKVPPSKRQSGANPGPIDPTNGTHNRFGWPVRKNEAMALISKKQPNNKESSDKRREKARTTLKGVRMNRRFELQMQSRMKNS